MYADSYSISLRYFFLYTSAGAGADSRTLLHFWTRVTQRGLRLII